MFNNVKTHLLTDSGLDLSSLEKALGEIYHHDNDYADLYFQSSQHESWVLEDGIIKDGSYNIERGVGVRAVSGEKQVLHTLTTSMKRLCWTPAAQRVRLPLPVVNIMSSHWKPAAISAVTKTTIRCLPCRTLKKLRC